jgi:hypothetical protein
LESKEKNQTFDKVKGDNMNFFLNNVGSDAAGLYGSEQKKNEKMKRKKNSTWSTPHPCFLIKRMQGLNLALWTESELQ